MSKNKYLEKLSQTFKRMSENGREFAGNTIDNAENLAAKVVITGKKIYDKLDIEKRATGATFGAKTAVLLTWRAGPVAMKTGIIIGTFAGAVLGPEGIDRFNAWREKHEEKQNNKNDIGGPDDNALTA